VKVSITSQIDEVQRELKERERVYAHLIASRKLRQSIADYQMDRMRSVLTTLEWLRDNETDIRAAVAAIKERRKADEQQHSEGEGTIAVRGEGSTAGVGA